MTVAPAGRAPRSRCRPLVAALAIVVPLAGCTPDPQVTDDPDPSPSPPAATATPTATSTPQPRAIEFEYRPPDSPCPDVSALHALPPAGGDTYVSSDPFLQERDGNIFTICSYRPAGFDTDREALILPEHVIVSAEIKLYRRWEDSQWSDSYPALPVHSDDLDDWATGILSSRDRGVWREGCDPDPCGEGAGPTVATHAWQTRFTGHVGNLELHVRITYVAEQLPPDAEQRTIAIFRGLVLAAVDHWHRTG